MKRLTIAVDCDDVLVPSTEFIVDRYNELYGTRVSLAGAHTSQNPAWEASREEAIERVHAIQHSIEYGGLAPYTQAVEACQRLSRRYDLHLVTARPASILAVTSQMLERYFPGVFKEIMHIGPDGDKGTICQALAADVLIDDNIKHLQSARDCAVTSCVWYGDYPWQQPSSDTQWALRCRDWGVVEREIERIAT